MCAALSHPVRPGWAWLAWLFIVVLLPSTGCTESGSPTTSSGEFVTRQEMNRGLFDNAIAILNGLGQFDEQSALVTVVDRLNQWIVTVEPLAGWRADPALDTLPSELQKLDEVYHLGDLRFLRHDGYQLREVVWLRDIARQAVGDEVSPLVRAHRLFDWTVRNLQLAPDAADNPEWTPHMPWEILLLGEATAEDRAWVFVLLCRQLGIDAVALAVPELPEAGPTPDAGAVQSSPAADEEELAGHRLWAVGVWHQGELYLYDPRLGLPLPGPEAAGYPEPAQVATLREVASDDALLRQLDVSDREPYPYRAADARRAVALIEAAPVYLAHRMSLVESWLLGDEQMVLSVDASGLIQRLAAEKPLADARLWRLPYRRLSQQARVSRETYALMTEKLRPFFEPRPILSKARMLHITGRLSGKQGAGYYYQGARPSEADLARLPQNEARLNVIRMAKRHATYWLGLVAYDLGNYDSAVHFLEDAAFSAPGQNPWRAGARLMLARTYEALGRWDDARRLYRQDDSLSRHGSRLRLRWLTPAESS